jgi:hypothetical protein
MTLPVPVNPASIQLKFRTRTCGFDPDSLAPQVYTLSQATTLPGVNLGTQVFSEACLALFSPVTSTTVPTNNDTLQALIKQFSNDYLLWRQTQFDINLAGVAAVIPNGLIQVMEISYNQNDCFTRISTLPDNFPFDNLAHQLTNLDDLCPDDEELNTAEPCAKVFGPPYPTQSAPGTTSLDQFLICFEDGRLTETYLQTVTYNCGCIPTTDCCNITCIPCVLPKQNLALSFTSTIPGVGNGSIMLAYNGSQWSNGPIDITINGVWATVSCLGGKFSIMITYNILFPPGGREELTCIYTYPGPVTPGLFLINYTCSPFMFMFGVATGPTSNCFLYLFGATTFTLTGPAPPSEPNCCVNFCATNCGVVYPGAIVTVQGVTSGVTGSNGCLTLNIGTPGVYTVSCQFPGTFTITNTYNITCCTTISFEQIPFTICCLSWCGTPYNCGATVTLTDLSTGVQTSGVTGNNGCVTLYLSTFDNYDITIYSELGVYNNPSYAIGPSNCNSTLYISINVTYAVSSGAVGMLTDANGTWPIYPGTGSFPQCLFFTCYMFEGATPMCGNNTQTPIAYCINCNYGTGGNPNTWAVTRGWCAFTGPTDCEDAGAAFEGPNISFFPTPCACGFNANSCGPDGTGGCNGWPLEVAYSSWGFPSLNPCSNSFSGGLPNTNPGNPGEELPDPVGGGVSVTFFTE